MKRFAILVLATLAISGCKSKIPGFTCEKAQYTSPQRPGAKITRWYSKDLDWAVKTEMIMGPGMSRSEELKNVKVGRQPASLFELPRGYKKVAMQMPKGMPMHGGMKKPGAPKK